MIQIIKSECKVLSKSNLFKFISLLYILFFLFMFWQKAFNTNSGFFQVKGISPMYMISYNLLLFTIINSVFSVILGVIVGGFDFRNNTWELKLSIINRKQIIYSKIFTILVVSSIYIFVLILLGFISGIVVSNNYFFDFNLFILSKQIIFSIFVVFLQALFTFTITFIVGDFSTGTSIGLLYFFTGGIIKSYISYYKYFMISYYTNSLTKSIFINLKSDKQIGFPDGQYLSEYISLIILLFC